MAYRKKTPEENSPILSPEGNCFLLYFRLYSFYEEIQKASHHAKVYGESIDAIAI